MEKNDKKIIGVRLGRQIWNCFWGLYWRNGSKLILEKLKVCHTAAEEKLSYNIDYWIFFTFKSVIGGKLYSNQTQKYKSYS